MRNISIFYTRDIQSTILEKKSIIFQRHKQSSWNFN